MNGKKGTLISIVCVIYRSIHLGSHCKARIPPRRMRCGCGCGCDFKKSKQLFKESAIPAVRMRCGCGCGDACDFF